MQQVSSQESDTNSRLQLQTQLLTSSISTSHSEHHQEALMPFQKGKLKLHNATRVSHMLLVCAIISMATAHIEQ